MKFTAAGDMIIQKRICQDYEGFAELSEFIKQGDARFFNLETTLNYEGEACASQFSGGTYLRTNPEVLDDIAPFGFNMTSFNNNHAMDYSYDGLEMTLQALEKRGLVHSGVGRNMAQASAPRYLETANGRVALIALNTTFDSTMMAGDSSPRVKGRAGINGLRINSYIELPKEDIDYINKIAELTNINVQKNIERKEGYHPELLDGEAELGEMKFKQGDSYKYVSKLDEEDMKRVEKSIFEAKLQADYIIISIHSHQLSGDRKENVSEFLVEFARRCIDMGANAILGHGPHLLRPIEVYKDCPIFYSLGDFVLQLYDVEFAPSEFFAKYALPSDATVHELLKKRSDNFTRGLMTDVRMFRSVIPCWETEGTKLTKLTLLPIELSMTGNKSVIGLPRRCDGEWICDYLSEMCKPFGTKITLQKDGILSCEW